MRKQYLSILFFVKFGFNYSNPDEFINYICEKCDKNHLKKHLRNKFDDYYARFGSLAVMNRFFVELDTDLQEALVEYALNVYAPKGMFTRYEEYKSL